MYRVGICGHFGVEENLLNGQTIKTKILTEELENKLGKQVVSTVDTYGWKKNPISLLSKSINLIKNSENIIILPAHNGVKVFAPLFANLNKFYNKKLHYIVIGAWLPDLLMENKRLINSLSKFDGIYAETKGMIKKLNSLGLQNVYYLPNFKRLNILEQDKLVNPSNNPYELCTFSRVSKQKGIEDAINSVISINNDNDKSIYKLDIYGPIDETYKKEFNKILNDSPDYIQYKGTVAYDKSVDVLKNYFALLFPTQHPTEGIPGTIIDAYAAGIPVISSKWENFDEVVDEGKTGIGYKFGDAQSLKNRLLEVYKKPSIILDMKVNCLAKAEEYSADNVINDFTTYL